MAELVAEASAAGDGQSAWRAPATRSHPLPVRTRPAARPGRSPAACRSIDPRAPARRRRPGLDGGRSWARRCGPRAFPSANQGDIDTQQIAGAVATATHGSGLDEVSFSATVRRMTIVTAGGEVVRIGEDDPRRLRVAQVAVGMLGAAAVLMAVIGAVRAAAPGAVDRHRRVRDRRGGREAGLASRYLSAELVAAIVLGLAIAGRPVPSAGLAAVGLVAAVVVRCVGILRAYDQAAGRSSTLRSIGASIDPADRAADARRPPDRRSRRTHLLRRADLGPTPCTDARVATTFRTSVLDLPPPFPDQATAGYAAPGLVGEAWANFGWLGLGLFALVGALVERLGALIAIATPRGATSSAAALATLFVARTHALGLDGVAILHRPRRGVALVGGARRRPGGGPSTAVSLACVRVSSPSVTAPLMPMDSGPAS